MNKTDMTNTTNVIDGMSASYSRHQSDRVHSDYNRGLRGVSLSEMVITVALVAILAAVALPRWAASIQLQRVNQAANRIVSDLSRAQDAAYNTSTSKLITFTVGSSQYLINGVTPLDHASGPYLISLREDPYQCTLVTVWGQTGTQTLTFNGYGLPDKGGNIVVASGNTKKTIVVDAGTGTAVIQ